MVILFVEICSFQKIVVFYRDEALGVTEKARCSKKIYYFLEKKRTAAMMTRMAFLLDAKIFAWAFSSAATSMGGSSFA